MKRLLKEFVEGVVVDLLDCGKKIFVLRRGIVFAVILLLCCFRWPLAATVAVALLYWFWLELRFSCVALRNRSVCHH